MTNQPTEFIERVAEARRREAAAALGIDPDTNQRTTTVLDPLALARQRAEEYLADDDLDGNSTSDVVASLSLLSIAESLAVIAEGTR